MSLHATGAIDRPTLVQQVVSISRLQSIHWYKSHVLLASTQIHRGHKVPSPCVFSTI